LRKEAIETAKSVDAAIEAACASLGCKREECEFEIIDLPKKAFFGLRTVPAKVKVWIELPEAKKPAAPDKPKPPAPRREEPKPQQQRPAQNRQAAPAPAPERREEARPQQAQQAQAQPKKEADYGDIAAKEKLAKDYVSGMLNAMKLENEVEIIREDGGLCVRITGKGLGVMIGRRGETLDAVQYLTGLVVNRMEGDYLRVTIDCGDYRVKRQETLQELARRVAEQVRSTNVSKTLEPMNPFERRIIHSTVSEIEGVSSLSVGEEPNRRVVITTPTARRPSRPDREGGRDQNQSRGGRPPRRDGERPPYKAAAPRGDSGGRGRRDRDDRGERSHRTDYNAARAAAPATPQITPDAPKTTPEATNASPLYTKIDLD
jgi:spoIIIJ-associated protein